MARTWEGKQLKMATDIMRSAAKRGADPWDGLRKEAIWALADASKRPNYWAWRLFSAVFGK